jgi:mRNA interferase HigB
MNIIGLGVIDVFSKQHSNFRTSLSSCVALMIGSDWKNIMEVRETFPHADAVGACTVFNIKGNDCRLITKIDYQTQTIYIKKVLTHAEYDKEKWKKDCGS